MIKHFFAQIKKKENLPFIAFAICLIIIHFRIHLVPGSDDDFMSTTIRSHDIRQLYANNRIVLNFFGAFIMYFPIIIWKILNIFVLICLIVKISQYMNIINNSSDKSSNTSLNWGICFLFFLLPFNVLSSGVFWVTGSFNYLWGLCGSLFICMVFIKDMVGMPIKKSELVTGLILGIYACDVEQSMIVVSFSGIMYLSYCIFTHKKIKRNLLIYGIILIVECMPIIFLPFSSHRYVNEQYAFYPDFEMLSLFDKIYQGAMYFYNHLVNELAIIFLFISILTAVLVYRNIKSKILHVISILPLLYFLYAILAPITILNTIVGLGSNYYVYDFSERLYHFDISNNSLLAFFSATFIFVLQFLLLFYILKTKYQKFAMTFFYFTALADGMIMSFVPSIFISGNRVFLVPDILFLTLAFILGKIASDKINIPKSLEWLLSCIAFCSMLLLSIVIGGWQSRSVYY